MASIINFASEKTKKKRHVDCIV